MKKKITLYVIAAAILAIAVIGGTLAFFTDETEKKTNSFTFGEVDIDLEETADRNTESNYEPGTPKEDGSGFEYPEVVPGVKYSKKPVITVDADSEDAYVFAEISVTNYHALFAALEAAGLDPSQLDSLLCVPDLGTGEPVDHWLTDDGVFHIVYTAGIKSAGYKWTLFEAVQVPAELTQEMVESLQEDGVDVAVKGYGVQAAGIADAAAAWAEVDPGEI